MDNVDLDEKRTRLKNPIEISRPDELLEQFKTISHERKSCERVLRPNWIVSLFLLYLLVLGLLAVEIFGLWLFGNQLMISAYGWGILAGVFFAIYYYFIWWQNGHLKRERALRRRLRRFFEIVADSPEKTTLISSGNCSYECCDDGIRGARYQDITAAFGYHRLSIIHIANPLIFLRRVWNNPDSGSRNSYRNIFD